MDDDDDLRLTEKSFRIGLASEERMRAVSDKKAHVEEIKQTMSNFPVEPDLINPYFSSIQSAALTEKRGAPEANAIPKHNGNATKKTTSPAARSPLTFEKI